MITANEILIDWKAGNEFYQESFLRTGFANYFDGQGVLRTAGTGVKRYPHYINDTATLLLERTTNNLVVSPRDLTNAAWTAVNATVVLNVTGITQVANSSSRITANSANATVLQTIAGASTSRALSAYVKRVAGSGVINMTMDGGGTWTPIPVGLSGAPYLRVRIPAQSVLNPTVGFQIVTSGDSIAVDFVQLELGFDPSSPVVGTRNADTTTIPWSYSPSQAFTFYVKFIEQNTDVAQRRIFRIGGSDSGSLIMYESGGVWRLRHNNTASTTESTVAVNPAVGDLVELRGVFRESGVPLITISVNGGAETLGSVVGAIVPPAAWAAPINMQVPPSTVAAWGWIAFKVIVGEKTLAECRAEISPGSYSGGWYLAEKGHVAPPAPPKPRVRKPSAAELAAKEQARRIGERQNELAAAEANRIARARKLWGDDAPEPDIVRLPNAMPRDRGPKIVKLPKRR